MHVFVETKVKCKTNHTCAWCGGAIEKREMAMYRRGVDDHEFFSDYFHLICHAAMLASDLYNNEFTPYEQERGELI